jgi:hypothetical protein
MNAQELAQKLSRTQHLYAFRGFSNPADCAQDQLSGRTHYADPDTLRFHHARILSARPEVEGLFYRITESCALDYENTARGFRVVLFDLFGQTVYRPSLEECRKTRDPAERDFTKWLQTFDPVAYYRDALEARADRLSQQAAAMREIFETAEAQPIN